MKQWTGGILPVFVLAAAGCAGTAVTPGTPHSVARAAAAAYTASGHTCNVKNALVYCEAAGRELPLLMGYDSKDQALLFATVFDTEAAFGLACPAIPADRIARPSWMVVKCDEVEYADKTKKTVLSVLGGGRVPDRGMSRAELNRSAAEFMQEAEGYVQRLRVTLAQEPIRTRVRVVTPTGSTTI